jgi:hypothetical protein
MKRPVGEGEHTDTMNKRGGPSNCKRARLPKMRQAGKRKATEDMFTLV